MNATCTTNRRRQGGFTFAEFSVSMAIATAATAGCLIVFVFFINSYNYTTLLRTAAVRSSFALDRMVYGVGTNPGLREAFGNYIQTANSNGGWKITFTNSGTFYFQYTTNNRSITDQSGTLICTNVLTSTLTNVGKTVQIKVSVTESAGGRVVTNTMGTQVQFRN